MQVNISQDVLSATKRIGRELMRFAYRDVGKGREQDAEASQAQHILRATNGASLLRLFLQLLLGLFTNRFDRCAAMP